MSFSRSLPVLPPEPLPQYVPSAACLRCDVCCRFPEADSPLRPYFTEAEITAAARHGVDPARFSNPHGSHIALVPNPSGPGYLCPAFDPATSRCRIYDVRPLDCQLYPLAVMWSADGKEVVLGWDLKCPFVAERGAGDVAAGSTASLPEYAVDVAARLERDETIDTLCRHPHLIGPYQEDVVVVRSLPRLTERLRALALKSLEPADYPMFTVALSAVDTPLAAFAVAPHVMWRSLFRFSWARLGTRLGLFAEYGDGLYMPLPPIGPGPLAEPVQMAFDFMRQRNRRSGVSRIENIPLEWTDTFERLGYRVTAKDPDYLYEAADLVRLRGDRYKSQRAACNRFSREHRGQYAPYRNEDRKSCQSLLRRWIRQKEAGGLDEVAGHMLADAQAAHEVLLTEWEALGLVGRVVWIGGSLVAYTFGYRRTPGLYCVLAEVTDRSIPGLAAWLFREHCREVATDGVRLINTMDDSGLRPLRHSKAAYHPARLVPSYIAAER